MKTVLFNSRAGEAPSEPLSVHIMPESAVVVNRRPFFIPDFDDKWIYVPAVAFRISRLGKTIGTQFASRYFDAMTIAVRPIPVTLTERLRSNGIDSDLPYLFDGALLTGNWMPIPATEDAAIEGRIGDYTFTCSTGSIHIAEAIHAISNYMMLKMGDIIIPGTFDHTLPLELNDRIEGTLNGEECISFKIK